MTLDYCESVLLGPVPVSGLRHISSLILLGFERPVLIRASRVPYLLKEGDLIQCFEEALEVFWVAATTLSLSLWSKVRG